jgi:PKD repeat protein
MRINTALTALVGAALFVSACTVKDIDAPPLAGPSTFAQQILLVASRDTLTQNGVDSTDVSVTATGPDGQALALPMRAQISIAGVVQDFGTLSSKSFTTPATIRYTAPPGSTLAGGQVPTVVTLLVTPEKNGDFRNEFTRQLDIKLLPQGIILPTNPNLTAAFSITPASPQAFQTVSFDASASTNNSTACNTACSYTWDFGDGTSGSGITTSHVYRTVVTMAVTLTVTDARGAQATTTKTITPAAPSAPSGTFTTSPTSNLSTNTDIFFSAANVKWDGRTITRYDWNFGDGRETGSGVTTTHRFTAAGTFTVTLTVTDDLGATQKITGTVTITQTGGLTANLSASTLTPTSGSRVVLDATTSVPSAGASIVSYRFIYGDGGEEVSDNGIQSHVYTGATNATFTATVVVTDSNGKTGTKSLTLTIK